MILIEHVMMFLVVADVVDCLPLPCFCLDISAKHRSFAFVLLSLLFPMVEAGLQRNGVTEREKKREIAANQPRIQLCAVHVHVIRGN